MNIYLRDDRIKAIVPVMVAFDKNKLAIQPLLELPVFLYSTFFPAFKDKITKKENSVLGLNSFIMPFDDRFIHFLSRLKRPFAVGNDVEMRQVII
jgi:hypothetical protein